MDRVTINRPMIGLCHMQVCAEKDATDAEILEACNRENPSGTSGGWTCVIREDYDNTFWPAEKMKPVPCEQEKGRVHFMVSC